MKRISIIIATYNRSRSLLVTLESVAKQTLTPCEWECVVVDNNSSDDTQSAARGFVERHPELNIKVVFEKNQGLSHARNRGIVESSGEIVAIIDDDETINEEFAAAYLALFDTHPNATSAGGRIIPHYTTERPCWMSHFTELPIANPLDFGDRVQPFPKGRIPGGGNMAIRRSALDRFGLFDVNLGRKGALLIGGEESDLFERLASQGAECWYVPQAKMWHIIPPEKLTVEYFDKLSYNIGVSQALRARIMGRSIVLGEVLKWCVSLALALLYTLALNPQKGYKLLRMRRKITQGIKSI